MNTKTISAKTDKEMKEAMRRVAFDERTTESKLILKGIKRLPEVMKEYKKQKSLAIIKS